MLHSRPRLAAGLHTALHAFAWCMVLLWLAALFRLAVSDRVNDKATAKNVNILYHYGDLYGGDKEKMSLFVGGAKTIVNMIGESARTGFTICWLCLNSIHAYRCCTSALGSDARVLLWCQKTATQHVPACMYARERAEQHEPTVMNGLSVVIDATYRRMSLLLWCSLMSMFTE
jgi:hypothetical protein